MGAQGKAVSQKRTSKSIQAAVNKYVLMVRHLILFIYFTQLVVHDQLARKVRERGDSQPRQEKKRKERNIEKEKKEG